MPGLCVHQLIEEQASLTPNAAAVVSAAGVLTYRELDERAGRLAAELAARGVGPEKLVGVVLERSPEWLVALLAVWRSGGAYLPVDPALPREVAAGMLADAKAVLVLADGAVPVDPAPTPVLDIASLDLSGGTPARTVPLAMENLAYCMFTSGSTGRPKPVAVTHASIANHAVALRAELGLRASDRMLQFTPMAIDAALEEILPAWLAGAAVVLPDQRRPTSWEFTDLLRRYAVSVVSLPSAYWHQWVDDLRAGVVRLPGSVRTVFVGGDKIRADRLAAWAAVPGSRAIDWLADYGPTETTISVTLHRPCLAEPSEGEQSGDALVPIGRPLANCSVYVLDDDLRAVQDGALGDLWIGGTPLARGYLAAPAATADRFVPDPFGAPGSRMYRTGDRGTRRPDGTLVFLGRADRQVKIRGHRVEPGQVEGAALRCAGVRDAVVIAREDRLSGARLVVYAEVEAGVTEATLRADLADRLPEVMVPRTIVLLDRIPRSELNGKVALAELPSAPAAGGRDGRAGPAEPNTLEQVVATILAEVLGWSPGREKDFFAAGGDSLQALQLLSRVAQATGVAPTFAQLRAAPHVAGIAALVQRERGRVVANRIVTPAADRPERLLASRGQQALWYLHRLQQGAPTYAVPLGHWIRGPLDVDRMDAALTEIVARHEALRTVFEERDGRVWQRVQDADEVRTEVADVADRDEATRLAEEAAGRPFDLTAGPLLRSSCFRVGDDESLWLLNVHHSVFDAWSLAVFWREFAALYAGRALPEPATQYADYCAWQQRWLRSAEADEQRTYWREQLDDTGPVLEPGTRRDAVNGHDGFAVTLPHGFADPAVVEEVARECGSTPFTVLLAAFFATLRRTGGGADEAVVGVPVACRTRPGTEDLIGYLVNTVALRMRFTEDMRFHELVARTDEALAEALTHQELPFTDVVEGLDRDGPAEENPLFQAMFVLQSTPLDGGGIDGLAVTEHLVHSRTAKVALTCTVRQGVDGLTGEVEYAANRFDDVSARRWQDALRALLAAGLADPGARIDELPLLPANLAADLVAEVNAGPPPGPVDTLLHSGFADALRRTPDAPAVEAADSALTYAELDARAEAVAAALAAVGIGPESLVGVCVPRSADLVVGLLGVLKAGAGFVPLDPAFPAERLRRIAADSGMAALVAASPAPDGLDGLPLFDPAAAGGPAERPSIKMSPRNAAFVYYTSGSTGVPKGVVIDHGCAALRVEWIARRYDLAPGRRVVHKTPLIFDVAIWEIFATLGAGATVLLAADGAETDVPHLAGLLRREDTVLAHFVPSMLDMYLATAPDGPYPSLGWVQLSGEAVPAALLERFARHFDADLHNMYGQTETSEVAAWEGRAVPSGSGVPLGRAINGYRLFVLDEALQPVPPGVVGELHVARADGLARGYRGRPALTAERFLPNPYAVTPGERLYRTGDLASVDEDGVLHYAGRADGQVKLRGVRVEPGEVEAVLAAHPAVERAAVVIRDDGASGKEIVAYLTGGTAEVHDVAEHAARHLSRYVLPAVYVTLDALPLTPSGKVDRRALPAPTAEDRAARGSGGGEDAASLIETELAELWRDLLHLDKIGRWDNFFAVGGSSLSALQMLHRLKARFDVSVTVREFFSAPTIAGIAGYVEKALIATVSDLSAEEVAEQLGDREGN